MHSPLLLHHHSTVYWFVGSNMLIIYRVLLRQYSTIWAALGNHHGRKVEIRNFIATNRESNSSSFVYRLMIIIIYTHTDITFYTPKNTSHTIHSHRCNDTHTHTHTRTCSSCARHGDRIVDDLDEGVFLSRWLLL